MIMIFGGKHPLLHSTYGPFGVLKPKTPYLLPHLTIKPSARSAAIPMTTLILPKLCDAKGALPLMRRLICAPTNVGSPRKR